jgi:hypothetical protein
VLREIRENNERENVANQKLGDSDLLDAELERALLSLDPVNVTTLTAGPHLRRQTTFRTTAGN